MDFSISWRARRPNKEKEHRWKNIETLILTCISDPNDFYISKGNTSCCNRHIPKFQWLEIMEVIHITYQTDVPGSCVILFQMVVLEPSVAPSCWSTISSICLSIIHKVKECWGSQGMGYYLVYYLVYNKTLTTTKNTLKETTKTFYVLITVLFKNIYSFVLQL